MRNLNPYEDYSREEVHDLFSPTTRFTRWGSWGLQGMVAIREQPGNYVFFVTFGQHQGDHKFDEWITEEGAISWQSQPRQNLASNTIQKFIHHDEKIHSIHLFLRTKKSTKYTYLGRLKYLAHHPDRNNPVYIFWQILDWGIPQEVLLRMNLDLIRIEGRVEKTLLEALGIYQTQNESQKMKPAVHRKKRDFSDSKQAILEQKVAEIRRYLNGESTPPTDEILCDWVSFCYSFELYNEGVNLFRLINPNNVNEWYYAKTKKLAKICELKRNLLD